MSPFVVARAVLKCSDEDECRIDVDRAEAVEQGAALIAKMIEKPARAAWMKATQSKGGLVQATSDEDCMCTAVQALLLAMEVQLEPPPPLGGQGTRFWGGETRDGPAICPLANLVLVPPEVEAAARAAGALNAQMGRPRSGVGNGAIRCLATRDLPSGELIISSDPSAAAADQFKAGDRVRVVLGPLEGRCGAVLRLRESDQRPIVRLEGGEEKRLVVIPGHKLVALEPNGSSEAAGGSSGAQGDEEVSERRRRRRVL